MRHQRLVETPVDQINVEERAARFTKRSIKTTSKVEGLLLAVSMCDLTTLEGKDTEGKVRQMCQKARNPLGADLAASHPGVTVAAVCVYPNLVEVAKRSLKGSQVKVAAVATGFPSGQYPLEVRLDDVRQTVELGADEIDMVINRGALLEGDIKTVFDEIVQVKEACGEAHLKVILETGEIGSYDTVRRASFVAMEAGADFIKTSTGKVQPAATMPVALVMLEAIRDFYYATGKRIGMKPAGGIRTSKEALHYLVMLSETLGDDWMTPDLFRFGASALVNDLQMQLAKQATGRYQSGDYFSLD
ncbi:MAG: deoxyribose-phosphate aldolase [Armatimonadetes bacterium]|nr:deoxyribose-phosphate aldolase [Armatimonadota bacterium]